MMISFKEFLSETPSAFEGDYNYGYNLTKDVTINEIKDWKKVDTIRFQGKEYILITKKEAVKPQYKLGQIINNKFMPVFGIKLARPTKIKVPVGYSNIIAVEVVNVAEELQGKGIATFMYNYFIRKMNYTIVSDQDQFFGARKLWAKLSNEFSDIKVDVFNQKTGQIIEKGVIIYHGKSDDDFDPRYWARPADIDHDDINNKLNLRFILRKIS